MIDQIGTLTFVLSDVLPPLPPPLPPPLAAGDRPAGVGELPLLPPPLLGERAGFGGVLGTVQFEPDQPVAQTHVPFPFIPWLHVPC